MIEDSEIKDGMVVWIKASVSGKPQKCMVMGDVFEADDVQHVATLENFKIVGELFDTEEE